MQNLKNCIIIHWCPDSEDSRNPETRTYDKHWLPWLKGELSKIWIEAHIPMMPDPWAPEYDKFKEEFEKYEINEQSILIWHSYWCAFLVRWLGETKRKIDKLIMVAPWIIPIEWDKLEEKFYVFDIDESIKDRVNEIIIFTSDNEEDDGKKSVRIFSESLGGRVIELKWRGHFVLFHMWTEEFPELLKEIIKEKRDKR
jgi:predicted alpha/beta hydrolase family esterase